MSTNQEEVRAVDDSREHIANEAEKRGIAGAELVRHCSSADFRHFAGLVDSQAFPVVPERGHDK